MKHIRLKRITRNKTKVTQPRIKSNSKVPRSNSSRGGNPKRRYVTPSNSKSSQVIQIPLIGDSNSSPSRPHPCSKLNWWRKSTPRKPQAKDSLPIIAKEELHPYGLKIASDGTWEDKSIKSGSKTTKRSTLVRIYDRKWEPRNNQNPETQK